MDSADELRDCAPMFKILLVLEQREASVRINWERRNTLQLKEGDDDEDNSMEVEQAEEESKHVLLLQWAIVNLEDELLTYVANGDMNGLLNIGNICKAVMYDMTHTDAVTGRNDLTLRSGASAVAAPFKALLSTWQRTCSFRATSSALEGCSSFRCPMSLPKYRWTTRKR